MLNKILIWGGLALTSILIIENMVLPNNAYFFIDSTSKSRIVALATNFIGMAMGYGIAGMMNKKNHGDDDLDF